MRRNRHKQVRKALRFYKINHGFKVPFKVLVDGNFVNALLELKRGEVQDLVPQFLGEKCRVFTTRCCVNELRKLGLNGASRLRRGGWGSGGRPCWVLPTVVVRFIHASFYPKTSRERLANSPDHSLIRAFIRPSSLQMRSVPRNSWQSTTVGTTLRRRRRPTVCSSKYRRIITQIISLSRHKTVPCSEKYPTRQGARCSSRRSMGSRWRCHQRNKKNR